MLISLKQDTKYVGNLGFWRSLAYMEISLLKDSLSYFHYIMIRKKNAMQVETRKIVRILFVHAIIS